MRTHVLKRLIVAVLLLAGFATVSPLPAVAAGVTGIDIYVINSNGVRCGQDCVSQSQAQVAMCVRSSQNVVNYTTMSYGYTLRRGATVVSSSSYSPLDASSTCVSGYMHTWDFRDLTAGESYEVEGWMIDVLASFGIEGLRREGLPGIWVQRRDIGLSDRLDKIVAIGV